MVLGGFFLFIFILALFIAIAACFSALLGLNFHKALWMTLRKYRIIYGAIVILVIMSFLTFFVGFTGPTDVSIYPRSEVSQYKLPWKSGIERWVAQGNRSFTTHRGFFEFSWDFVMPVGTPILSSRSGVVSEVVQSLSGIGFFHGNRVVVTHDDGTHGVYAHIKKDSALVTPGQRISQGQTIAEAGMVGATTFPHLHFHVLNREKSSSIPISFADVPNGIPFAGNKYQSRNTPAK